LLTSLLLSSNTVSADRKYSDNLLRNLDTCKDSSDTNCLRKEKQQKRNFFNFQQREMPNPIILNSTPTESPKAIVVFCHGLGDTGDGWSMGFRDPSVRNKHVKYLFLTADTQPVTLNAGFPMPSWFDLYGLSPNTKEDEAGIEKASVKIIELIDKELAENPHLSEKDVILGGFSQGGGLALYAGLTRIKNGQSPIGGIIALSTWLPLRDQFLKDDNKVLKELKDTRVLQGHGDEDPVVPFQFGQLTSKILKQTSLSSEFKSYSGMGHSSCEQEMKDVKEFIEKFVSERM